MRKFYVANFKKIKFSILALCLLLIPACSLFSQTVTPYTTPGTYTFTVPAGVSSITVSNWGGGGAGGGVNSQTKAGGGGEGGSFVRGSITVVPGATYTIVVGGGGTGASSANGGSGLASSFSVGGGGTTLFNAIGGVGGVAGTTATNFGAGGNATNSGNIVSGSTTSNFYGGNGGMATNASFASSGGGGGSAGAGGAGGNGGSPLTAGTAGAGSGALTDAGIAGAIGRGSSNDGNGNDAIAPGGGGSGGRIANNGGPFRGGNGGNGQVILVYTQLTYKSQIISVSAASTAAWCAGETRNVQVIIKNTGTATWTDANPDINIGVKWNTNGANWTDYYIRTDAGGLAPGATTTYTLPLTASNNIGSGYTTPLASGTNNLIFDVVYEGISWFGDNGGGVGPLNTKFTSPGITINALPGTPTGTASQSFCSINNPTVANLAAVVTAPNTLNWFSAATGGTALATTTALVSGTHYYASQTTSSGCQSAIRFDVTATINNPAAPTSAGPQSFCAINNPTVANLTATGTAIKWYTASTGGTALATTTALATGTYYASQTVSGCESATRLSVAVTVDNPAAPTGSGTQSFCAINNPTVANLVATGSGIQWYSAATGGTALATTIPLVTGTHYYASQTISGCEGISRLDVTAAVANPAAPTGTATQTFCSGTNPTVANLTATGSTIQWYSASTGGTALASTTLLANGAHYYASQIVGTCESATRLDVTVVVNMAVSIATNPSPATQTICAASNVSYMVAATGTGLTYQWMLNGSPVSNGGRISGATSATLTITGATLADDGDYSVVVSGLAPCTSVTSGNAHLDVDQKIIFTVQPLTPQTICEGQAYTISASATGTISTYQWYKNGSSYATGTFDGATTYTLLIPAVTPGDAGSYRLLLDDGTGTGCTAANSNIAVLSVNPTPLATITGTTAVCQSSSPAPLITFTNPNALPVTITYNINGIGTLTINVGANTTGTVAAPTGTAGTFDYNIVSVAYQSAPSCSNSIIGTATITVNPKAAITAKTATTCSGTGFSVTPVDGSGGDVIPTGTTYSWAAPTVTGSMTGGATGTNASSITGTLTNSTNTAQTATYTITPISGSCAGTAFTVTVTVNSKPTVTNKTQTICSGGSFTVTPVNGTDIVPSGTTYSWSAATVTGGVTGGASGTNAANITGTLTNPTNTAQTATYTVTPTSGSCTGSTFTVTVTVSARASITAKTATTCSAAAFAVTPVDGSGGDVIPAGTTYSWAAPTVTGSMTGGATGTNASSVTGTLTNPTNTAQTATYTVTPTSGSCPGTAFTITVTVNPKPTIVAKTQTICSGGSFTVSPANGTDIVPAGTTYTWSIPTVTGGVTGGVSGTNASSITGTLTNPTNTNQTATYTVTSTSGSCTGTNFTVTITVSPSPFVTAQTSTACSGVAFTVIPANGGGNIVPTGTTYSWSAPTVTGGVTGGVSGTNAANITGTLTNPTNTAQTVTYTVTPTSGSCTGSIFTVTVTVNPKAAITAKTATTCSGTGFTVTPVDGSGGDVIPTGTTYSWTAPTATGITGGASGSGASSITGTLTNTTSSAKTITYTVTPTSGTCAGPTFTVTVTVNPKPSVTNKTQSTCSGTGFSVTPTDGSGSLVPTGTTYSWNIPVVTGGLTGGAAGTNATSITGTLTNPTNTNQTATYTVTPASGSCTGSTFTVTITVTPQPSITNQTATTCSGSGFTVTPANGSGNIVPTGTTYSWSAPVVTGGMTGGVAGTNQANIFGTLNNPTATNQTATYTITPTSGTCTGATFTVTVTVNPLPTIITTGAVTPTCFSSSAQNSALAYTTTTQSPTTYSINWASGLTDVPANTTLPANPIPIPVPAGLAPGTYTGVLNVKNANGCVSNNVSVSITINPLPIPTLTNTPASPVCANTNVTYTTDASQTNYVWTFSGVAGTDYTIVSGGNSTSNTAVITWKTSGTKTVTINYTNSNGCSASTPTSNSITVLAVPTGTFTETDNSGIANNDKIICAGGSATFTFSVSGLGSYIFKVNGVQKQSGTANVFSSSTLNNGDNITVDVANASNCGATFGPITMIVDLLPVPTLAVTPGTTICPNASVTLTAPANAGSTYSFIINGTTVNTGSSNTYTTTAIAANAAVAIMETNSKGCQATTATQNITVSPVPSGALIVSPGTSFCAGTSVTFTATAGVGNTYNFKVGPTSVQNNSSNTYTTTALANSDVVTVVVTNSSGCSATFNAIAVTVNQPPSGTLNAFENSGTQNDNSICANAPVTFTFSNTTYSGYNFKVNGVSKQNNGTASYINNTLTATDAVTVVVTSGSGCTATFSAPTIIIVASPVITLAALPTTICAGDNVTFTATPLDPTYNYNFQVNGATVQNGLGNNTYNSTSISSTDVVTVDVTNSNSCTTTSNPVSVTVNPLPTGTLIPVENSGNAPANDGIICTGATVVFTAPTGFSNYDFILNGATVQSGTGNTYTNSSLADNDKVTVAVTNGGGCVGLLNVNTIKVNPLPVVAVITGTTSVCLNSTTQLSDATTGGVWSSLNTGIATVDASGLVTGVAAGTATINYTITNTNGCIAIASTTVTVNAPPVVAPIMGNFNVCTGSTSPLNDATVGGIWTSGSTAVATIDASGLVTGVAPGTAVISYSFTDVNDGCTTVVTATVTVANSPVVAAINPAAPNICAGGTITLSDATTGGVWSSSNTAAATITSSGVVTGVANGISIITYTITTSCGGTASASTTVTVNTPPSATIAYTGGTFCTTSGTIPVSQTGTTGGTYSSAAGLTINSGNGTITPATSIGGLYTVTYTVAAAGGCGVYSTTAQVTITAAPSAIISYSGGPFCTNTAPITVTRTGTAGGTYSSAGGLTINAATGTITPSTSTNGTYTVTYTIVASGGCAAFTTTTSVIITTAPSATIAYSGGPFCTSASPVNVTLTGTSGGTYSSAAGLTIAAGTGTITPATSADGTYVVTYTIAASGGCAAFTTTASVTINAGPTAVAGANVLTCSNSGAVNITTGSSATNQASVLWTSNGTGIFTNANSLTTATYAPSAADIIAGSRILTLTANGNGSCAAATSTKIITISAPPATPIITPTPVAICNGGSSNLVVTVPGSGLTTIANYDFNSGASYGALVPVLAPNITSVVSSGNITFNSVNTGTASGGAAFTNNVTAGNALNYPSPSLQTSGAWTFTVAGTAISSYTTFKIYFQVQRATGGSNTVVASFIKDGGVSVNIGTVTITNSTQWYEGSFTLNTSANNPSSSLAISLTVANSGTGAVKIDNFQVQAVGPLNTYSWTATPSATSGLPGTAGTFLATNNNISVSPSVTTDYFVTVKNTNGCTNTPTKITVTVNPTPVVTIIADYCAVAGKVRLTASSTPTGATYSWNTVPVQTGAVIDVDIADDYTVTATIGSCIGTATISVAQELVTNGDFTNGNTGFTSDYTYKPDIGGATLVPAGQGELYDDTGTNGYSITPDGSYVHTYFFGQDHTANTTGTRNFMAVNGHGNTLVVWKETVTVLPNTTYYFSAWAMSLNDAGPFAKLQFNVNGTLVGTTAVLAAGRTSGPINGWVRFYGTWTSGATTTSADIQINDLQSSAPGNDFGLDDISFGTFSTFVTLESAAGTDAQTPCVNTAITPIQYAVGSSATAPTITPALPAGLTYTFNGVLFTISGTPTVAGNYAYTITTTGSCQPSTATGTINVQAQKITLSSGSASPSVCINTSVNVGFALGGTATGATVTGPSFLTGSVAGTTYTISGTPTVAGSYPYTISTTGNCAPVTFNGTITVTSQTITLNSGSNTQTVCITSPIANIQYAVGGTGNNATVSGLPPGVAGTYNSGLFIISGSPTSAAGSPYSYTVTTAGTSCAAVTASGTITVTPGGSLSLTSAPATNPQTVCKGTAIVDITYAVTNATGASASGLPTGVNGGFSGGVFTISGTPTATAGTFNYTVTTSGGCVPASATGVITIQSQSIVLTSGTASPSVCMNTAMTNIVYTIGGTATGATVTGLPASGVIYSISGNVITISGTPNLSGALPYLITTSGTCTPVTANGTITVQPAAIGGTLNSVSICSGGSGSLTLSGQSGSITRWEFSTNGGTSWTPTPILNTTITQSFSNITVPTLYRVLVTNGCSPVFSSIATVGLHNLWVGGTSSDWNTASNWSDNLVPSMSCPAVTIPAVVSPNLYPVLSIGAIATINNLVINSGASLIITNNTMQIAGTITNNGTFDVSNGSVELNGTSAQTIPANVFATNKIKDLIISNNVSIAAASGQDSLTGMLTFSGSNKTFNTNDKLTLKSTAANTAAVGQIINGNSISGNVTVERYISAKRAWRFLSVPTNTTQTFHQGWQENQLPLVVGTIGYGTQVTNIVNPTPANGFDYYSAAGPSVKKYDITATGPYAPYRSINATSDLMATTEGIMTFVRGDRTAVGLYATPTITVLRTQGPLKTQNQTYTVSPGAFKSIGNPYAAPLDMRQVDVLGTKEFFYIWDPNLTGPLGLGAFQTFALVGGNYYPTPGGGSYPSQSPSAAPYNYIQSGSAFFVAGDPNATSNKTVTITESSKASSATAGNVLVFRPASANQTTARINTNLYAIEPDASLNLVDGTLNQFADMYSNAIDRFDAVKITNFAENLAIKTDGQLLVVERKQSILRDDTIHLNMLKMKVKSYRFEFIGQNFAPGLTGFLEDSYYNTRIPLNINATTTYDFNVINVPGSWNPDRFRIVFATAAASVLPVTFTSVKAYPKDNDIAVDWKVEDERNIKAYEVERSADGQHFSRTGTVEATGNNGSSVSYQWPDIHPLAGSNYYRIKSIGISGEVIYSNIVKVVTGSSKAQLMVYPNPVSDGNINLQLINQPKGSYGIRLMNKLGQVIMVKQIDHLDGSSTEHLSVKLLAHGAYNLEVTLPDNTQTNINVLY